MQPLGPVGGGTRRVVPNARFRPLYVRGLLVLLALGIGACGPFGGVTGTSSPKPTSLSGIQKIQHVIVIMQENRSFDHYFGTYPGADGVVGSNGQITVCVNDPATGQCVKPYHNSANINLGAPHNHSDAVLDINGGSMDGFIADANKGKQGCASTNNPACGGGPGHTDVMGYHDAREIPNYWSYAQNFVLQDHLFEPNSSWSLPQHLFMVSEWSAYCSSTQPSSCTNEIESPATNAAIRQQDLGVGGPHYAWTDLTWLLHSHGVSWKYYVEGGTEPDCADGAAA